MRFCSLMFAFFFLVNEMRKIGLVHMTIGIAILLGQSMFLIILLPRLLSFINYDDFKIQGELFRNLSS